MVPDASEKIQHGMKKDARSETQVESLSFASFISFFLQKVWIVRVCLVRKKKIFKYHVGYVGRMSGEVFGY
jgi:hypothetical protein